MLQGPPEEAVPGPSVFPSRNPACRGTCGGRRKAVRDRLALQGGTGVPGILQARTLEWAATPSSRGSSRPRDCICALRNWHSHLSSVQSLSWIQLFATPWTAAHRASLSIPISWSLLKLMSIESVMPTSHLTLCSPLSSCPQSFQHQGLSQ